MSTSIKNHSARVAAALVAGVALFGLPQRSIKTTPPF